MKIGTVKKLHLLPAVMLLSIALNLTSAHALNVMGVIDRDTRWTVQDSPVHITGDLKVASGAILTIDPGTTVVFDPRPDTSRGYNLTVEGSLKAIGREAIPIIVTAGDREAPWGAIVFADTSADWNDSTSTGSVISGSLLEYGGNHPDGGMIIAENAAPLISGNVIRFSDSAGIVVAASEAALSPADDIQIVDNRIHSNPTGLYIHGASGLVSGNYFLLNTRAMDITSRAGSIEVSSNTVVGSSDELFGAGLLLKLDEPGSGIASYAWVQTGGPAVALENPGSVQASFIAPDPGNDVATLTFDLTVTGAGGTQAMESTAITVIGSNEPPVASAGSVLNVRLPDEQEAEEEGAVAVEVEVTLNGAGSYDPDTGIAGYAWAQKSGDAVVLQNPNSVKPSFIVPASVAAGDEATFELTVTDDGGLESTDSVIVRYYLENIRPVADAGDDLSGATGQTISLDGSGSRDIDGGIARYSWTQTGGTPITLSDPNAAAPSFTLLTDNGETLIFSLEVEDIDGLTDADEVEVRVNGIVSAIPGADRTVSAGDRVTLNGSGSVDLNAEGTVDIAANTFQWDNDAAGLLAITAYDGAEYQLGATGNNFYFTDTAGLAVYLFGWEGTLDPIDMPDNWWGTDDPSGIDDMIYDNGNDLTLPAVGRQAYADAPIEGAGSLLSYPPIADAGPDMEVSMDTTVTLDGSGSYDPDGNIACQWQQTGGRAVTLKDSDRPVASFTAPSGGTDGEELTFTLTVMTDNTFSHTDEAIVAVRADEEMPIVETGGSGCFIQTATADSGNSSAIFRLAILAMTAIAAGLRRLRKRVQIALVTCFALLPLLLAGEAGAGYVAVGGGDDSGDAEQYSIALEAGAADIPAGPASILFAVGIPLIPHGDENLPENTIAVACPNDDCRMLEPVVKGTETGLYAKLGIELGSSGLYLNAIGGATVFTESELTFSEATGNIYEESADSKIEPLYGGGLSLFLDTRMRVVIQVDYDNRRGVCGSLGWWW